MSLQKRIYDTRVSLPNTNPIRKVETPFVVRLRVALYTTDFSHQRKSMKASSSSAASSSPKSMAVNIMSALPPGTTSPL